MMTGTLMSTASASGTNANGLFSRRRISLSVGAEISSVRASITAPNASRCPQRRMLATASRARTGVPSWKRNPSRSVSSHCLPSSLTTWPATICGCGR